MNRATRSIATSTSGLGVIVVGLAIIDVRVREHMLTIANGGNPSAELRSFGGRLQELAYIGVQAVRDQSIEHAPLTLFALAALVLFVLMLRTDRCL